MEESFYSCYSYEVGNYIGVVLAAPGVVANIINIIVFSHESLRSAPINRFFLAKSCSDLYFMLVNILEPLTECSDCVVYYWYAFRVFEWIYRDYLNFIAQLSSMMLEVMVTFERYAILSTSFKIYKNTDRRIFIFVIFLFCALFYSYKFVALEVIEATDSFDQPIYYLNFNEFGRTKWRFLLDSTHSSLRDGLCVVLIIIFNCFIIMNIKQTIRNSHMNSQLNWRLKRDRAEHKVTVMVILTGISTVIAHSLQFLYFVPIPELRSVTTSDCYVDVMLILAVLSYEINFVFYLMFNKIYKKTFLDLFHKLTLFISNTAARLLRCCMDS